jgi:RimJ/RimL family protein N-acetyltransferase
MEIRSLAWTDFDPITDVYYALYDEVQEDPDLGVTLLAARPTLGEEAEWFARLWHRIEAGNSLGLVAVVEGRAVGLCTVDRKGPSQELGHLGVLGIMVGKAHRRHGLGRALLREVIARAPSRFELLELAVFATNTHARALYESVGFRAWGHLPKGVRRNGRYTDVDYMVLELAHVPSG